MIKKLLIFSLGLYFLSTCTLPKKEKEESTKDKDKLIVNSIIDKQATAALSTDECLPVAITKSGLCRVTDTSDAEVYLKPNTTLIELFSDSISPIASLKFCYAYVNKGYTIIKFHEANFSDKSPMITIYMKNDSFHLSHSFVRNGKITTQSDTKFQNLVVDKQNYQVGDSISGYLAFSEGLRAEPYAAAGVPRAGGSGRGRARLCVVARRARECADFGRRPGLSDDARTGDGLPGIRTGGDRGGDHRRQRNQIGRASCRERV